MDIVSCIKQMAPPGMTLRKPESCVQVRRWGRRRGEPALVYLINGRHEKGITESEWRQAFAELEMTGEFTRSFFRQEMPRCHKEGSCNYTTIGAVFEHVGVAIYRRRGVYAYNPPVRTLGAPFE